MHTLKMCPLEYETRKHKYVVHARVQRSQRLGFEAASNCASAEPRGRLAPSRRCDRRESWPRSLCGPTIRSSLPLEDRGDFTKFKIDCSL